MELYKGKYMPERVDICNVIIDNVTIKDVLIRIDAVINAGISVYFVTPNVDHIVKLQKDRLFAEVYKGADLVLADGMPLLWISRLLNTPLKQKISGSDLFPLVCGFAEEKGHSVFLLGGRPGAALAACAKLQRNYPDLKITGSYCPPYGFENSKVENGIILSILEKEKPDILFVGLGAPKQEKWIYEYSRKTHIHVSIGIGVTFEYYSGIIKRAPKWVSHAGFEWLWRVLSEPNRLWRRYFIDDIKILYLVYRQIRRNKYSRS